ncbi:MAG: HTTM domain-containing protein [Deltaproteobacteria bacterium]|nr:HTTM domain-containing protein [Deltaproteobacteria bacterium]
MQAAASASETKAHRRPRWIDKWDQFWFKPQTPLPMAIFRILFGLVLLENLLVHLWPDFDIYYSKHNLIPIQDMIAGYWHSDHMFDVLLMMPNENPYIYGTFYVLTAATVCMTLGLFTRLSSWLVFLLLMSFGHHFELNQNAGDNYMRIAAMCIAFSSAGDALSLDRLFKTLKQDWRVTGFHPVYTAPWAQRLLQLQLMIAYFHTWLCKIEGAHWNDGTAVYYAVRYDDVIRFPMPHFLDQLWFYQLSTWGTLVIEFIIWNLIWWRPARYWVILTGVLLHLGIEYFMNLPMFEWNFMFTYLLFVYPEDFTRLAEKIKAMVRRNFGEPLILAFDGANLTCVKYAGFLHRLDIFGRLLLLDSTNEENKSYVEENMANLKLEGQVYVEGKKTGNAPSWLSNFKAFRRAAICTPLLFIVGVLAYIPVLEFLIQGIYILFEKNACFWFGASVKPAKPMVSEGAAS